MKTVCKLRKRESFNDSSREAAKQIREKQLDVKRKSMVLDFKDLQDCKKWLFKDQRYSIEEFSTNKPKTKPVDNRSFSVNSIARELYKVGLIIENANPSFQTILSTDYIGISKQEIDDFLNSNCKCCSLEFRINDVLAELICCSHIFHKTCLDDFLFGMLKDSNCLACPICKNEI